MTARLDRRQVIAVGAGLIGLIGCPGYRGPVCAQRVLITAQAPVVPLRLVEETARSKVQLPTYEWLEG